VAVEWERIRTVVDKLIESGEFEYVEGIVKEGRSLMDSDSKGKSWQVVFSQMAEERGLCVEKVREGLQYDVRISGLRVQCRATDYSERERICITQMRPVNGVRKYNIRDVDVLSLRCAGGVWLFPSDVLRESPTSDYMRSSVVPASMPSFKDKWDIFTVPYTPREKLLF
jgi:hypothetical protein